jgi:hypothetical protein
MGQVVEHLPNMYKALTTPLKKKKTKTKI